MSRPVPIEKHDLDATLFCPRFGVEQARADGSSKLRAVDHFSWSADAVPKDGSVNGFTFPFEKMKHDTLDKLAVLMRKFVAATGVAPGLIKADIDAAYRRIPIRPDHQWACGGLFKVGSQVRSISFPL